MGLIKKLTFNVVRIYRHSTLPQSVIFLIDITTAILIYFIVELLQTHSGKWEPHLIFYKMTVVLGFCIIGFLIAGTHRTIIRHLGIRDMIRLNVACGIPMLILIGLRWYNNRHHLIDNCYLLSYREVVEMFSILVVVMIMGRILMQWFYNEYFRKRRPIQHIIIFGAGTNGVAAINALRQDMHTDYDVVSYIDENASKSNQRLNGIPVLSRRKALNQKFVKKHDVTMLLIALPALRTRHKQGIINKALNLGLTVKTVPQMSAWIDGEFSSSQIEDINIEDLLNRDSVTVKESHVRETLQGKVVLVTGAAGSIGSGLCPQIIANEPTWLIMLDQSETSLFNLKQSMKPLVETYKNTVVDYVVADINDERRMHYIFEKVHPQIIFHAAAYKRVSFLESNPYEAVMANIVGTRRLADLAESYRVEKFLFISTDKAINPTNVMGATKRIAELCIQSRGRERTQFIIARFGNMLGSTSSVVPLFRQQLSQGGPITITHRDVSRYFISRTDACTLILETCAMGHGGDSYVFDMGQPIKIYEMAQKMIKLSGRKDVQIHEIGLQPGEKLYEEFLTAREDTLPTYHPKIMQIEMPPVDATAVDSDYDALMETLQTVDPVQIVAKLQLILPEYASSNSRYSDTNRDNETKG